MRILGESMRGLFIKWSVLFVHGKYTHMFSDRSVLGKIVKVSYAVDGGARSLTDFGTFLAK